MKCERCKEGPKGYGLHDYCRHCSKNLCETCMTYGYCALADDQKHAPANHGGGNEA